MAIRSLRDFLWPLLLPLAFLWAMLAGVRRRLLGRRRSAYRAPFPVVCFGNLHSGGSGKTPLVLAAVERFASLAPVVVSRGYRSHSRTPRLVEPSIPNADREFGDEPTMMARRLQGRASVCVGARRAAVLRFAAEKVAPRLAILDDGFQHFAVQKDVSVVVVAASRDPLASFCLPYGDLREGWGALRDADAVVVTAWDEVDAAPWRAFLREAAPKVPVFVARGVVRGVFGRDGAITEPHRYVAFCGIAGPERFFRLASLQGAGEHRVAFADHASYGAAEEAKLREVQNRASADAFLTTEKDWAKVQSLSLPVPVHRLEIAYEPPDEFWYLVAERGKLS